METAPTSKLQQLYVWSYDAKTIPTSKTTYSVKLFLAFLFCVPLFIYTLPTALNNIIKKTEPGSFYRKLSVQLIFSTLCYGFALAIYGAASWALSYFAPPSAIDTNVFIPCGKVAVGLTIVFLLVRYTVLLFVYLKRRFSHLFKKKESKEPYIWEGRPEDHLEHPLEVPGN